MKNCPFNHTECNETCALFIAENDLNELMASRLKSISCFSQEGVCSLKALALSSSRHIFENTATSRRLQ